MTVPTQEAAPQAETPQAEQKPQRFGIQHVLALVFAVGVTVVIVVFQEQINKLGAVGYLGAFLVMLVGNATLILPAPALILVYALGKSMGTTPLDPLLVGLVTGAGATLGEFTGYAAGFSGSGVITNLHAYQRIEGLVKKYGVATIALLAFIPNPLFDVAGIAAGVLKMKWWQFLAGTLVGKVAKTIIVAYAGYYSLGWIQGLLSK